MVTNNQYYKKILEKLTSTTISGNHTNNYYIRRIAQHYGVEDTNKCNGRLLKAIAEILTETTFGEFHFINFYLKKIAETLSRRTYPTVHSDNFYLGVFCQYCVDLPYNGLSAWTDDKIISYNGGTNPESATLSAQLLDGESEARVEGVTISFKVSKKGTTDVIATLTAETDADGYASASYTAAGVGDVCVETEIEGSLRSETYGIEDLEYYHEDEIHCNTTDNNYITIASLSDLPSKFILSFDYKTNSEARVGLFSSNNFSGNPNYSVFVGSPNGSTLWYYGGRTTSTNTSDVTGSPTDYHTYTIRRDGNYFYYQRDGTGNYNRNYSWFANYSYLIGMMGWGANKDSYVKNIKLKKLD